MNRRSIDPVDMANLIRKAQMYRAEGCSQIESARAACLLFSISDDWAAPILGFLNDSPSIAEAWAERMFNEALDRAAARMEAAGG